jgi:hypothetical protein
MQPIIKLGTEMLDGVVVSITRNGVTIQSGHTSKRYTLKEIEGMIK